MQALRIIKRYPNRRLYDTQTSCYITLDEVEELVLQQAKFKIIDNDSNEDMTSYILLQIISEREKGGLPVFTTEVLENIIRFYGNPLQKSMSELLEKSFALFTKADMNQKLKSPALDLMADLTRQNLDIWQNALAQYFIKNKQQTTETVKKSKKSPGKKTKK